MPTKHLLIMGKVQGVFYRATAKEIAVKLGITGWIRNTSNGNVEAKISGASEAVSKFIAWCHIGPPGANVTEVKVADEPEEYHEDFRVAR
jgi:acylphosphatase